MLGDERRTVGASRRCNGVAAALACFALAACGADTVDGGGTDVSDAGTDTGADAADVSTDAAGDASADAVDTGADVADDAMADAATSDAAISDALDDVSGDTELDTSTADAAEDTAVDVIEDVDDFSGCRYGEPVAVGEIPDDVVETSGLARSRAHEDTFWIHGDSGQAAVLRAISGSGALLATLRIVDGDGAPLVMRDWEDMSAGPCDATGAGDCLYIGDVGDNAATRSSVTVLQVTEPAVLEDGDLTASAMTFTYETGPLDVEAFVVDAAANLTLLTKRPGENHVLSIPWEAGEGAVAVDRGTVGREIFTGFSPHMFTGADFDEALGHLIIRAYAEVFDCEVDPTDIGDIAAWRCREAPFGLELQGEAIAWAGDGAYVHISEARGAPVFRVECADAP